MAPATHGLLAGYDYEDPKSMSRLAFSLQRWMKDQQSSNSAYLHGLSPGQVNTLEVIRLQTAIDETWNRLVGLFISAPRRSSKTLLKAANALVTHAANLQEPRVQPHKSLFITDQATTSPALNQNTLKRAREAEAKPPDNFSNFYSTPHSSSNEESDQPPAKKSRLRFLSPSDELSRVIDRSDTINFGDETSAKLQSLQLEDEKKNTNKRTPSEVPRDNPKPVIPRRGAPSLLSQNQIIPSKPRRTPFTVLSSLQEDRDIEEFSRTPPFIRKDTSPYLDSDRFSTEDAQHLPVDVKQHMTQEKRDQKPAKRLQEEENLALHFNSEEIRILEDFRERISTIPPRARSLQYLVSLMRELPRLDRARGFQYESESGYTDSSDTDEILEEEEEINPLEKADPAAAIELSSQAQIENTEGLPQKPPPQVLGKRSPGKDIGDKALPPAKRVDRGNVKRGSSRYQTKK